MKAFARHETTRVPRTARFGFGLLAVGASLLGGAVPDGRGQLAITEVMSSAATNCLGVWTSHPDFWELTNFGTNTIDLSGYIFRDTNVPADGEIIADGVTIGPGESIVFARRQAPNPLDEAAFCEWWGLVDCPQIQFYTVFGFADEGEELWLWDANTNLVDLVTFGEAPKDKGVTFTFDPISGRFGEFSEVGVCGAFRAAQCDEVGSPGRAICGPVALAILQQPTSQNVDAGMDVLLSVQARGLPQPRLQWFFNDSPLTNDGAPSGNVPTVVNYAGAGLAWRIGAQRGDLAIRGGDPANEGRYFAVLDNGLERMTSAVVTLVVNTNPAPPRIESPTPELSWPSINGQPQTNLVVAPGQTARFAVLARGYPPPEFQWSWSGDGSSFTTLVGETNSTLVIPNAQVADAGIYRVGVSNRLGVTNVSAALTVKLKPRLKITEAMAEANQGAARPDWWELTNVGDEPVQLYGIRWDDSPGNIGAGPTITNLVTLEPGESVIFHEGATSDEFVRWWGSEDLAPHLKLILHTANGLNLNGDEINVWNPTATRDNDFIDSVVFSTARVGASFWFRPDDLCSEFGVPSVEGECGAFRAAEGGDVGSPGWTDWTPPCLTSIRREGSVARLEWKAQPGSTNRVQYTSSLPTPSSAAVWMDLGSSYRFAGATGTATDASIGNDPQRFYRVVRISTNDCPCTE